MTTREFKFTSSFDRLAISALLTWTLYNVGDPDDIDESPAFSEEQLHKLGLVYKGAELLTIRGLPEYLWSRGVTGEPLPEFDRFIEDEEVSGAISKALLSSIEPSTFLQWSMVENRDIRTLFEYKDVMDSFVSCLTNPEFMELPKFESFMTAVKNGMAEQIELEHKRVAEQTFKKLMAKIKADVNDVPSDDKEF